MSFVSFLLFSICYFVTKIARNGYIVTHAYTDVFERACASGRLKYASQ